MDQILLGRHAQRLGPLGILIVAVVLLGLPAISNAACPKENGLIAYHTNLGVPEDDTTDLFTMKLSGRAQINLTHNRGEQNRDPAWSPDGTRIAFGQRDGDIYVMKPDGTGQTNLTKGDKGFDPAWSPDGSRIAFTYGGDIYQMKANGTDRTPVTTGVEVDTQPAWSPDGSRIAFTRFVNREFDIWLTKPNGTDQVNLSNSLGFDGDPEWSPGGSRLIFTSARNDVGSEIYVMNEDGSRATRVTNNSSLDQLPAWSPDGTKIAFATGRDGGSEIYVMNTKGDRQTNLTRTPNRGDNEIITEESAPDWQPVSNSLLSLSPTARKLQAQLCLEP